ncbi:TRAF3-interacting protein 1 [Dasypus novemcinctus]|uniref:TRAF3-interacting protein 1 n=1 Tax=Dasypus novemcinctus TaxID=9361 RepID=UPI00266012D3|nr:TRAF3-interacting protein 1 [Dasypus novemcinctus]
MNAAVVRRTQEALGKVIRRPPLTEKLLSKPPFRYLHDIITEVIRMTGFLKGLYTDAEMKSDNVKDKDAKISFLQKAIDVVLMVSGEPLSAKPARIVAGHEPERTNELLQLIGKCCANKLSSDDAVKRVLAGEKGDAKGRSSLTSKSQELDNKNAKEEESRIHRDKEDRRNSEIKERSTSSNRKQREEPKEESKPREKERDKEKEKTKENDRDRPKDPERDKHREGEREKSRVRAKQERERDKDRARRERERDSEREKERRNEGGREKEKSRDDKGRDRDKDKRRGKNGEHSRDPEREKNREHERAEKKSAGSSDVSKKVPDGSFKDSKAETETENSTKASRSVTTKASKRRLKTSVEGRRDSRTNENSLSLEKEHNSSSSKAKKEHTEKQLGRKEDNISAKILDPIVSGLNNEPDQESATSEIGTKEANTNSASVSDDHTTSLWRGTVEAGPVAKQQGDSTSDAEGDTGPAGQDKSEVLENSENATEFSPGVRRMPRPGSARPAPPRVKRQESAELLTVDRTGSGKTVSNVIIDSQNSDNEEDDQFVVEAAPQIAEISEIEMVPAVDVEDDEKHGGLVKKILETKKDYEKLQQPPKSGEKERLLAELAELEQLIKDQQDKICAVKASILKNEEKIQKWWTCPAPSRRLVLPGRIGRLVGAAEGLPMARAPGPFRVSGGQPRGSLPGFPPHGSWLGPEHLVDALVSEENRIVGLGRGPGLEPARPPRGSYTRVTPGD